MNPGYTVLEAIVTGDAEAYYYSFPENEEEKAIVYGRLLGSRREAGTIDREYALGQVELLYEVWETPQKFFAQDVEVKNVYAMSEAHGLYVYTITDQGDFVVFREYTWKEDVVLDTYVFPADEFEVFRKIQAEEWRSAKMKIFDFKDYSEDRLTSDYSIAKVIERSEYKDELPKYAVPFDIEQHEKTLKDDRTKTLWSWENLLR
jgi:hypothetical protein